MLKTINFYYREVIEKAYAKNPWTNVYGLARSFIALSLLITLLSMSVEDLFPTINGVVVRSPTLDFQKMGIFYLLNENMYLAWVISITILILVIIGVYPQITGVLHWWVAYSYMVSGVILEGGDQAATILTLLLIPVCLGDNRNNHWKKPKPNNRRKIKFFVWSVFAIVSIQVSIIYLHAAVEKIYVEEWKNGTAIYYWLTHEIFGVPDSFKNIIAYVTSFNWVANGLTWGTIILELLLFGWIFCTRNSLNWKLVFISAVLFHLLITIFIGLVSFMFTMFGAIILYTFPKDMNIKFSLRK